MIVCASIESFPDYSREEILPLLVDLEYTAVELPIHESGQVWVKPSAVLASPEQALAECRATNRLSVVALSVDQTPEGQTPEGQTPEGQTPEGQNSEGQNSEGDRYYEEFAACCKLAKALKVVPLVIPAAELGTPFNAEIERLREVVRIASFEGCLVALKTQIGCMTEDPDTAVVLCDNVKGLGLSLDPSHYIVGPRQGRDFSKVMPYVFHVQLRDSTKSEMHVRVGQGEIDYGKLISQLAGVGYERALTVHTPPIEGFEHRAELRKIRLLLESLL